MELQNNSSYKLILTLTLLKKIINYFKANFRIKLELI